MEQKHCEAYAKKIAHFYQEQIAWKEDRVKGWVIKVSVLR